jgi:predicted acylesterase/phospholipase RssA
VVDALRQVTAKREVVLVYRPGEVPTGTDAWIAACGAAAHHHVREGDAGDMRRLVRLLTGRAIGLVLSGGGARGFAHIGVIEALRDAGIPIDAIGGTSMGAVIAAQYATGADPARLRRVNREQWADRNPLKDKTLPVVALLAGHRLERMIDTMFGDRRIEDLWTRCFCVSADLTHAQMRVHDRGPLGRAVRASMSLPGIAIPVHEEGAMLVDGGLLNNLPADVMREMCGRVIAVDVSPSKDLAIAAPYPPAASGWRLLWGRGASKLPGIGAILMRSVLLGSTRHQQTVARDVDLYLHPPLESYGMFEWTAVEAIADAGYAFARQALAAAPVLLTE